VRLHGQPFRWEPGVMAYRFEPPEGFDTEAARIRDAAHFEVVSGDSP
jgi:hypothetical protein